MFTLEPEVVVPTRSARPGQQPALADDALGRTVSLRTGWQSRAVVPVCRNPPQLLCLCNPTRDECSSTGSVPLHRLRCVGTLIYPDSPGGAGYFEVVAASGRPLPIDEIARGGFRGRRSPPKSRRISIPQRRLVTDEARERLRWRTIVAASSTTSKTSKGVRALFAPLRESRCWRCFADVGADAGRVGGRRAIDSPSPRISTAAAHDLRCSCAAAVSARLPGHLVGNRLPQAGGGFFDALVQIAGCEPGEILIVGDDRETITKGARRGLSALLVIRDELRREAKLGSLRELAGWLDERSASP